MRLTLKMTEIHDVTLNDENEKVVILQLNEETLFSLFDRINPKTIVKYLDMRNINHRDAPQINIVKKRNVRYWDKCGNAKKLKRLSRILETIKREQKI